MAKSGSRSLAMMAVLATGTDGARIARKKGTSMDTAPAQDCFSKYDGHALLTLNACASAEETVAKLEASGCYILDEPRVYQLGCTDAEVVCSEGAGELEKEGIAKIVSADAGAFWRGESGAAHAFSESGPGVASDFYSDWRDLESMYARMRSAVAASGGAARLEVAGQSLQGRDMYIVRFKGEGYVDGGKRLVLTFNLHAREWITGMAGIYAVEKMVEKVKEDPSYLAGTEVVMMPMANPDGFLHSTIADRMHRKNMKNNSGTRCIGVDLNRNFDAHWNQGGSSNNPCSDTYHGTRGNSEVETEVIAGVMKEAPMTVYIDTHSFTQLVITSPAWTRTRSARHADYRKIGYAIQQGIKSSHGLTFTEGPVAEVLYTASGGSIDYADDRGALGVCLELRPPRFGGGAFAPNRNQILPSAEETFEGILAAIDYAKDPSSAPPPPATPAPSPWFWR